MGRERYAEILLSEMDDFERQFNRFWMRAAGLYVVYFACWVYYFYAVVWFWLLIIEFNHTCLRCSFAHQMDIRHCYGV
ncbi:hypothetical protein EBME_0168 [bacterium endosymbiont of Mortierella elongata FMR23-6]|nr:hypothetical protein EBME_0168 [bacterium endosymbiont of Mortierella elongata FMR23-6]